MRSVDFFSLLCLEAPIECGGEILNEVVRSFQTDGETNEPVGDSELFAHGRVHILMRRADWLTDERFDPSEAWSSNGEGECLKKDVQAGRGRKCEAHHSPEPVQKSLGPIVIGMAWEPRISNLSDSSVAFKCLRDCLGISVVFANSRPDRF